MKQNNEKCCGNCCYFKHEAADGWGMCYKSKNYELVYCGAKPCKDGDYVSEQTMRHHLAVLICHNRWRRDDHVPNSHKMQDPKEIGEAIDFAVDYIKTFMNL